MIINQCVEQGIYVVLILALEKDHRPLSSSQLSSFLSVSDSYLKKILRKLVLAGIIISCPGKDGGYQLARSLEDICVYDIYAALEGAECEVKLSGIGNRIFIDDQKFMRGKELLLSLFDRANTVFTDELKKLPLSELADRENYQNGMMEFETANP